MLVFKKGKLVECSQEDFTMIECIFKNATCLNDAVNKLYFYLVYFLIQYKAESERVSSTVLKNMAYNAVTAVANKYKYLKVK